MKAVANVLRIDNGCRTSSVNWYHYICALMLESQRKTLVLHSITYKRRYMSITFQVNVFKNYYYHYYLLNVGTFPRRTHFIQRYGILFDLKRYLDREKQIRK